MIYAEMRALMLFQDVRVKAGSVAVGRLFFPVLFYPGFPALACRRVAAGKNKGRDVRVSDFLAISAVPGQNTDERRGESRTGDAIKDVTLEFCAVFSSEGDVAAIVECFFERFAELLLGGELGNPAFDGFALTARGYFELIWIEFARAGFHVRIHVLRNAHARDSSICVLEDSICTSGLKACTGFTGSFKRATASGSA